MRGRRLYLTFFGFHAFLILAVSSRDAFWLVGRAPTILPARAQSWSRAIEPVLESITAGRFAGSISSHLLRGYLNLAGIESGYSYFAPNVGDSYKLLFEFQHPDGRLDYDSFAPGNRESELRLDGLLDQVGKTQSDAMREIVLRLLTESAWRSYPEAVRAKAILAAQKMPTPNEYLHGQRATFDLLYAYDFDLTDRAEQ